MAPDTRELVVLALMAEEASNKAIARRLAISVRTVKFHIASLLDNLYAQGRAEAVAQGARLGGRLGFRRVIPQPAIFFRRRQASWPAGVQPMRSVR